MSTYTLDDLLNDNIGEDLTWDTFSPLVKGMPRKHKSALWTAYSRRPGRGRPRRGYYRTQRGCRPQLELHLPARLQAVHHRGPTPATPARVSRATNMWRVWRCRAPRAVTRGPRGAAGGVYTMFVTLPE